MYHIVVVCGYGCDLNSPLRLYLKRVARFCELETPEHIILCGGTTQQKNFPGCTEARVIAEFLKHEIDFHTYQNTGFFDNVKWNPDWHILGNSYTTYENIRDASRVIKRISLPLAQITIFCEATRALKVAILARHFMGFPPEHNGPEIRIETDSWERMHPFKELVGTIKDFAAIYLPFLNTLQRRQRIAKSKTR